MLSLSWKSTLALATDISKELQFQGQESHFKHWYELYSTNIWWSSWDFGVCRSLISKSLYSCPLRSYFFCTVKRQKVTTPWHSHASILETRLMELWQCFEAILKSYVLLLTPLRSLSNSSSQPLFWDRMSNLH